MKAALGLFIALFPPFSAAYGSIFLAAERKVFLRGEPVYLRMESESGRPPPLEAGETILAVSTPDSGEFPYQPPMQYRIRPGNSPDNGPRIRFARLIAHREGLLFNKAGRYRLRLVSTAPSPPVSGQPGKKSSLGSGFQVLSDTLELVISEPAKQEDKRAIALVEGNPGEYGMAVYLEGGGQLKQGMAIIRELAGFTNYLKGTASFVLSSDWSQDYAGLGAGDSRSLDLAKALSFAQLDSGSVTYIPLRNAFRLRNGAELLSRRTPGASILGETIRRLDGFEASLSARQREWYRSL